MRRKRANGCERLGGEGVKPEVPLKETDFYSYPPGEAKKKTPREKAAGKMPHLALIPERDWSNTLN